MSKGQQYSLVLHAVLILLMVFGLPNFMRKRPDPEPVAISVDILPIAPISNVKPQERVQPEPDKKPVDEKKTARKEKPETSKAEAKQQEKPEPVKPKETAKAEETPIPVKAKEVFKQKEKKQEKKEKKQKEDDLDSILKSVEQSAKAEESKKPTEQAVKEPNKNKAVSQHYDSSLPLSLSEKDSIRNQFQQCWSVPAGARDAENLIVTLHIDVTEDGTVTSVELAADKGKYNSDSFFRAAADSAMRAVRKCSPLKNLPHEKYGSWHDMELTFNPKDML